jgi:aminomethyltransferase
MPVQYVGVIAEAKAVRETAGMFDVGHMARLIFRGPQTLADLERITSNDVAKLGDRTGQYSLLPNAQGGCVDDIIVYRYASDEYRMVVNAGNHEKDVAWIRENGLEFDDQTLATGMIAVQGPTAVRILSSLTGLDLEAPPAFGIVEGTIAGSPFWAARSGYTGEDGYEIICPAEAAPAIWAELQGVGVVPCGLGARDVLRVEAGLPLYGHELAEDRSPIEAGLGWVVSKTKSFVGSAPIFAARDEGTDRRLVGVRLGSKRLTLPGMPVLVDGHPVGEVSSGVISPLLDCGIALAFVNASVKPGTPAAIEIRGKPEPGTIVNKRFYRR